MVQRAVGKDASTSSPNLMAALRAVEWLQEEEFLALESGCTLFAALCKEDPIYSQPMNQLTLNMSFLNLNPKKLFCLDLGLGRLLALSVGQLPDDVTGLSTMDPICVGSVRFWI